MGSPRSRAFGTCSRGGHARWPNERDEGDRGAVSASGGERGRRPYVQSVRERMVGAGNRRPPRPSPRRGTRARRFPLGARPRHRAMRHDPRPRRGRCHPETQVRRPQPRRRRLPRRANPRRARRRGHVPRRPRPRRTRPPALRAAAAAPREPPTRSRVSPTRVAARLDASGSTTAAACRAAAVVDDAKTSAPSSPPRTPPTRGSHLTRCSR